MEFWVLVLVILFVLLELWFLYFRKNRRFPEAVRTTITRHMEKLGDLAPGQQILEYDKILDLCLRQKGYDGSLGEKMKQYGKNFRNTEAIWKAHKLRNRMAHELGYTPSSSEAVEAVRSYRQEITAFLQ